MGPMNNLKARKLTVGPEVGKFDSSLGWKEVQECKFIDIGEKDFDFVVGNSVLLSMTISGIAQGFSFANCHNSMARLRLTLSKISIDVADLDVCHKMLNVLSVSEQMVSIAAFMREETLLLVCQNYKNLRELDVKFAKYTKEKCSEDTVAVVLQSCSQLRRLKLPSIGMVTDLLMEAILRYGHNLQEVVLSTWTEMISAELMRQVLLSRSWRKFSCKGLYFKGAKGREQAMLMIRHTALMPLCSVPADVRLVCDERTGEISPEIDVLPVLQSLTNLSFLREVVFSSETYVSNEAIVLIYRNCANLTHLDISDAVHASFSCIVRLIFDARGETVIVDLETEWLQAMRAQLRNMQALLPNCWVRYRLNKQLQMTVSLENFTGDDVRVAEPNMLFWWLVEQYCADIVRFRLDVPRRVMESVDKVKQMVPQKLVRSTCLRELALSSACELVPHVRTGLRNLRKLSITFPKLTKDDFLAAIAEAGPALEELSLFANSPMYEVCSDDVIKQLPALVPNLTSLGLSCGLRLTKEAMSKEGMCYVIYHCRRLVHVVFSNGRKEDALVVAEAIEIMRKIRQPQQES